jgi:hypothetical protein
VRTTVRKTLAGLRLRLGERRVGGPARRVEEPSDQSQRDAFRVVAKLGGGDARRPVRRRPEYRLRPHSSRAEGRQPLDVRQRHPDVDGPHVVGDFVKRAHRSEERRNAGERRDGAPPGCRANTWAARVGRLGERDRQRVARRDDEFIGIRTGLRRGVAGGVPVLNERVGARAEAVREVPHPAAIVDVRVAARCRE